MDEGRGPGRDRDRAGRNAHQHHHGRGPSRLSDSQISTERTRDELQASPTMLATVSLFAIAAPATAQDRPPASPDARRAAQQGSTDRPHRAGPRRQHRRDRPAPAGARRRRADLDHRRQPGPARAAAGQHASTTSTVSPRPWRSSRPRARIPAAAAQSAASARRPSRQAPSPRSASSSIRSARAMPTSPTCSTSPAWRC